MHTENNKKRNKVDKRTLMTRIVAWVLVLMMVVTALYTAIFFIVEQFGGESHDHSSITNVYFIDGDTVAISEDINDVFRNG